MESKIKQIQELASQKLMAYQIGEKIGVSKDTVVAWAKKHGIELFTKEKWLIERKQEILKLYKSGNEVNFIRKQGYSYELIKSTVYEAGLPWRDAAVRGKERRLSSKDVLSRLPNSDGFSVEGIDEANDRIKYIVKSVDGKIFSKTADKLNQGVPSSIETAEDFAKKLFIKTGKVLIKSSYSGTKKPCSFICVNGHEVFILNAYNALLHAECRICNNTGTSKTEQQLNDWVRSLGLETGKYYFERTGSGRRKEIDVYIPSLKIGIEYCGLYWHNEDGPQSRDRFFHKDKLDMANSLDIRLITVFEDEWRDRELQVKGFLKSILSKPEQVVYARKCTVSQIDKKTCDFFMKSHHIQGASQASIVSFGIYSQEELIGVVSGSKHHRGGNDLVLDRLCFKDGVLVIGGSSRLLSRLKEWGQSNGFTSLISWSDNRWSEGNVYRKMGFSLDSDLDPDYSYVNGSSRISKQSCKKSNLKQKYPDIYDDNKTEREMTEELGFHRIWDCGKKRWKLSI